MLDSLQSRKYHEQDGKEDLAEAQKTRTIGSGLRKHSDDQIRPLKHDDRPEMTKENVKQETEEEDVLVTTVTPDQPCTTLSDCVHTFTIHSIVCSSVSQLSLFTLYCH